MYEVCVVRQGTNLEDNLICQKKKKKNRNCAETAYYSYNTVGIPGIS